MYISNNNCDLYYRFGTFLCNCDKERHNLSLYATTTSIWAHLLAEKEKYINPDFVWSKQVQCMYVKVRHCVIIHTLSNNTISPP